MQSPHITLALTYTLTDSNMCCTVFFLFVYASITWLCRQLKQFITSFCTSNNKLSVPQSKIKAYKRQSNWFKCISPFAVITSRSIWKLMTIRSHSNVRSAIVAITRRPPLRRTCKTTKSRQPYLVRPASITGKKFCAKPFDWMRLHSTTLRSWRHLSNKLIY